jgi:signal transduction histidine kinase
MEPTWSFMGATIVVCALGIILDAPMRRWFGLDTRHLLLAPRSVIIEWARGISDEEELKAKFRSLLCDWCQTNSANLLSASGGQFAGSDIVIRGDWSGFVELCKEGWTTPETLHRSRPSIGTAECIDLIQRHQLGALLAVPMGSLPPSLVISLGQKESLRPYTFPEIQALLELAELMDNILTHSRVATHAAHIERMNSATMISRGLAHDLNNLATPVSTFLHHMDERVTPGTIEAKVLADAKSSIRVMQDYIQESLFFARQLIPSFTVIHAHSVLSDVIRVSSERAHEKNIHVIIHEGPDFTFKADFSLLRRLLQNLIFNAIDASSQGEAIEISAIATDDQQVCWQVADHGTGIPPEVGNRIFEPYFTTKNVGSERRGLGLGLAICQKIAELHEGRILISANSPHGTVFTTTFPRRNIVPALPAAIGEEPTLNRKPSAPTHPFGPTQTVNGAYP